MHACARTHSWDTRHRRRGICRRICRRLCARALRDVDAHGCSWHLHTHTTQVHVSYLPHMTRSHTASPVPEPYKPVFRVQVYMHTHTRCEYRHTHTWTKTGDVNKAYPRHRERRNDACACCSCPCVQGRAGRGEVGKGSQEVHTWWLHCIYYTVAHVIAT